MKRLIYLLMCVVFVLSVSSMVLFAQSRYVGHVYRARHLDISATMDSTETENIYFGFPGLDVDGTSGLSATAIDPKDVVWTTFDCLVYMYFDTLAAVSGSDSLSVWAYKLAHDGKTWGDKMYLDIATDHAVETAASWTDWTPQEAQSDTSHCYYWCDLTAEYEPGTFGFQFGFDQRSAGAATQNRVRFNVVNVE